MPPILLASGLATRLLDRETRQIEPQFGSAIHQRGEGRNRLVELTGSPQCLSELDADGCQTLIRLGDLREGIQTLIVGTQVSVAFGQHEVELDREPGLRNQGRPSQFDPGDRLGPPLPPEQDLGFQVHDEGVSQPGIAKEDSVFDGLRPSLRPCPEE